MYLYPPIKYGRTDAYKMYLSYPGHAYKMYLSYTGQSKYLILKVTIGSFSTFLA